MDTGYEGSVSLTHPTICGCRVGQIRFDKAKLTKIVALGAVLPNFRLNANDDPPSSQSQTLSNSRRHPRGAQRKPHPFVIFHLSFVIEKSSLAFETLHSRSREAITKTAHSIQAARKQGEQR